jgi:hypothetical protein
MKHKSTWAVIGLLALVGVFAAISALEAQRPPRAEFLLGGQVGRYQSVKVDGDNIWLLDTATGDLYVASLSNAKPYGDRPRVGERPRFFDKDKAPDKKPTDKDVFKDKKGIDKDGEFSKDKAKEFPKDKGDFFPKDKRADK